MPKIVIFSTSTLSGGPFAIYQLADVIKQFGVPVEVAFYNQGNLSGDANQCQIQYPEGFAPPDMLGIQPALCEQFSNDDLLIFPEIYFDLLQTLQNQGYRNTVLWWLSWQKFPIQTIEQLDVAKNLGQATHVFQSEYARAQAQAFNYDGLILSDYTATNNVKPVEWSNRAYDVCYLPRKAIGAESLIKEISAQYKVVELDGLDHEEVLAVLSNTKVFIDFGSQPGKDRIPREAAALNCIPIVRGAGAAKVLQDVPLPDYLKPSTSLFLLDNHLVDLIRVILDTHQNVLAELIPYRALIANEKVQFQAQTETFLKQMRLI